MRSIPPQAIVDEMAMYNKNETGTKKTNDENDRR